MVKFWVLYGAPISEQGRASIPARTRTYGRRVAMPLGLLIRCAGKRALRWSRSRRRVRLNSTAKLEPGPDSVVDFRWEMRLRSDVVKSSGLGKRYRRPA